MSGCCVGSGATAQLCQGSHDGTQTDQGWTEQRLKQFLEYAGSQGATTVTVWSGLEESKKPWNETLPPAMATCPWFVPALLDWVAAGGLMVA